MGDKIADQIGVANAWYCFDESGLRAIDFPGSIEHLRNNVIPSQARVIRLNDAGN